MGAQPLLREQPMSHVTVRPFEPGDRDDFRILNERWISKYFRLEVKDIETISDAQTQIVDKGGEVFMAELNGRAVGCVALLKMKGEGCSYELAKMAVDERVQGRGIGRALMNAAIDWARQHWVHRLYLETNHTLTPAITLYETSGFKRIPAQPTPYQRADVFMELVLAPEWVRCI